MASDDNYGDDDDNDKAECDDKCTYFIELKKNLAFLKFSWNNSIMCQDFSKLFFKFQIRVYYFINKSSNTCNFQSGRQTVV